MCGNGDDDCVGDSVVVVHVLSSLFLSLQPPVFNLPSSLSVFDETASDQEAAKALTMTLTLDGVHMACR